MEVVIIIIILSIFGYLIHQQLPSTKFLVATQLMTKDDFSGAESILNDIYKKHPQAPAKLAECYLSRSIKLQAGYINKTTPLSSEATGLLNQAISLNTTLPKNADRSAYELVQAKCLYELANFNFKYQTQDDVELIIKRHEDNLMFIESSLKVGSESQFETLSRSIYSDLSLILFVKAMRNEKLGNFREAINVYDKCGSYSIKYSKTNSSLDYLIRIQICRLKLNESVDLFEPDENVNSKYRLDFYFRYALALLKDKRYNDADKILSMNLSVNTKGVESMKKAIHNERVKQTIKTVDQINLGINSLFEEHYPLAKTQNFYDWLETKINEVTIVSPDLSAKIRELKPSLFNKLLMQYMDSEDYQNAIDLISKYPRFWESPDLLKNLGICCYGITSQKGLNEKNYKHIISSWLTSIFCDEVILNSLEATSWDDPYTFTLVESIGSTLMTRQDLPENVNYDDISESNISIGATQKELLQHFESLLHQMSSEAKYSKAISDFYEGERQSIQAVISCATDDSILIAAPFFSKTFRINEIIVQELDKVFDETDDEDALMAGIPYVTDYDGSNVGIYANATNCLQKIHVAIEKENLDELKQLFTDENKVLLENFDTIDSRIEDEMFSRINAKISLIDDGVDPRQIERQLRLSNIMKEAINFLRNNNKLKSQYSNFMTDFCVIMVNAQKISNQKAFTFMTLAYLYSKDNIRVCKNLIAIIRNCLMDVLNDKLKGEEIFPTLDKLRSNRSQVFLRNASELSNLRTEILNDLINSGVDVSGITSKESDHIRPTVDMAMNNLTPQGYNMKKVLSYMEKLSS